uniref:WW domain-containing protein n=1 Tax=Lates calcarifer TaxID=8187 RepID=A0A4W6EX02_LATCA
MAADPKPDWLSCLPSSWSYGVTRDGRIFFINEEAKSTTWLHPVTGEAVITGHRKTPDLPTGWEEGYTFEGARCFIKTVCMRVCLETLLTQWEPGCPPRLSSLKSQEKSICCFIFDISLLILPPLLLCVCVCVCVCPALCLSSLAGAV